MRFNPTTNNQIGHFSEYINPSNPPHPFDSFEKGCNKFLWESAPELATAPLKEGCIQEFNTIIAPKIIGGKNAMNPFSDFEFQSMSDVINLNLREIKAFDKDVYLRSFIK